MSPSVFLLSCLLTILDFTASAHAVVYHVTNNASCKPGGIRFELEIGSNYSDQVLKNATKLIWQLFGEGGYKKSVHEVFMIVEETDGIAYTLDNTIHLNSDYVGNYSGNLRDEVTRILYHETTHVWQWFGEDKAPEGLTEGIADFVRLKSGFVPSHWPKRGSGRRWDEGYAVTACFLEFCGSLDCKFIQGLNHKMRHKYSDGFFKELLGKSVDELWADYKSKHVV